MSARWPPRPALHARGPAAGRCVECRTYVDGAVPSYTLPPYGLSLTVPEPLPDSSSLPEDPPVRSERIDLTKSVQRCTTWQQLRQLYWANRTRQGPVNIVSYFTKLASLVPDLPYLLSPEAEAPASAAGGGGLSTAAGGVAAGASKGVTGAGGSLRSGTSGGGTFAGRGRQLPPPPTVSGWAERAALRQLVVRLVYDACSYTREHVAAGQLHPRITDPPKPRDTALYGAYVSQAAPAGRAAPAANRQRPPPPLAKQRLEKSKLARLQLGQLQGQLLEVGGRGVGGGGGGEAGALGSAPPPVPFLQWMRGRPDPYGDPLSSGLLEGLQHWAQPGPGGAPVAGEAKPSGRANRGSAGGGEGEGRGGGGGGPGLGGRDGVRSTGGAGREGVAATSKPRPGSAARDPLCLGPLELVTLAWAAARLQLQRAVPEHAAWLLHDILYGSYCLMAERQLDGRQLAQLSYSLAQMAPAPAALPPPRWRRLFLEAAGERLLEMDGQSLTNLAHSLEPLALDPSPAWLVTLLSATGEQMEAGSGSRSGRGFGSGSGSRDGDGGGLSAAELTQLAWAVTRAKERLFRPRQWAAEVLEVAQAALAGTEPGPNPSPAPIEPSRLSVTPRSHATASNVTAGAEPGPGLSRVPRGGPLQRRLLRALAGPDGGPGTAAALSGPHLRELERLLLLRPSERVSGGGDSVGTDQTEPATRGGNQSGAEEAEEGGGEDDEPVPRLLPAAPDDGGGSAAAFAAAFRGPDPHTGLPTARGSGAGAGEGSRGGSSGGSASGGEGGPWVDERGAFELLEALDAAAAGQPEARALALWLLRRPPAVLAAVRRVLRSLGVLRAARGVRGTLVGDGAGEGDGREGAFLRRVQEEELEEEGKERWVAEAWHGVWQAAAANPYGRTHWEGGDVSGGSVTPIEASWRWERGASAPSPSPASPAAASSASSRSATHPSSPKPQPALISSTILLMTTTTAASGPSLAASSLGPSSSSSGPLGPPQAPLLLSLHTACWPSGAWQDSLASVATFHLPSAAFRPQSLGILLWSLASLGYVPPPGWLQPWLARSVALEPGFWAENLVSVLCALSAWRHVPAQHAPAAALRRAAVRLVPRMGHRELALAASALAQLCELPPLGPDGEAVGSEGAAGAGGAEAGRRGGRQADTGGAAGGSGSGRGRGRGGRGGRDGRGGVADSAAGRAALEPELFVEIQDPGSSSAEASGSAAGRRRNRDLDPGVAEALVARAARVSSSYSPGHMAALLRTLTTRLGCHVDLRTVRQMLEGHAVQLEALARSLAASSPSASSARQRRGAGTRGAADGRGRTPDGVWSRRALVARKELQQLLSVVLDTARAAAALEAAPGADAALHGPRQAKGRRSQGGATAGPGSGADGSERGEGAVAGAAGVGGGGVLSDEEVAALLPARWWRAFVAALAAAGEDGEG
ncbi:hypothetical protein HYH03_011424 [Edaphochlamys debaryana]|uniref:Uncharacterized protein n=1 Tax=Edaphochlamys debaryana TaxID=47281 RepID=A0A835XW34_9CHLO|nr:hypothetical protein HYH03_011424 [Edaphochlamys debaryana]|eukprot:KAG2490118.1 hypothetical protein HYH03_011424 [Edaphochlamys debaryana]